MGRNGTDSDAYPMVEFGPTPDESTDHNSLGNSALRRFRSDRDGAEGEGFEPR